MLCMSVLQRGHSGDGGDLASTLCNHNLRKGDLYVLSWARVRRVKWGSISSEMPRDTRCIWRMLVLCLF